MGVHSDETLALSGRRCIWVQPRTHTLTLRGGWVVAHVLSQLGHAISHKRMVLSHTPMRVLSASMRGKVVLMVGEFSTREVAEEYNFQDFLTVEELVACHPTMYPHHTPQEEARAEQLRAHPRVQRLAGSVVGLAAGLLQRQQ